MALDRITLPVHCISHVYGHHASASGYEPLVKYLGGAWRPPRIVDLLGRTVLRLPAKCLATYCGNFEYSRQNCTDECAIATEILFGRPAIWHFLFAEKQFLLTAPLQGVRGNRFVGSFHHHPAKFPKMVWRVRHLRRLDHAIVMSRCQIEFLERLVGQGKVTFVPYGVDIDYWRPGERAANGRIRIVFAGNHMRDFRTLEGVVNRVLRARPNVEFVLLSSDLQCAPIARQKRVRWMCGIPDDLYRQWMQSAYIMVLPLLYSTAVTSVMEAMACGVPVVTTRGGISDYLDDDCAIQHAVGDVDAMAESVVALVDDESVRLRMGAAARRRAEHFAWPKVAEQVRRIYATVANGG